MPLRLWYVTRFHLWQLIDTEGDAHRLRTLTPRAPLFDESADTEQALVLKSGHVRIQKELPGMGLRTVEVVNPGEVVGLVNTRTERSGLEAAEVMDEAEAYVFPRRELMERAMRNPLPPSWAMIRATLQLRRVEIPAEKVLFRTIEARVAHVLRTIAERHPGSSDGSCRSIGPKLATWKLADLSQTNREVVRLMLDHWAGSGVVCWRGGRIVLTGEDALASLAEGA